MYACVMHLEVGFSHLLSIRMFAIHDNVVILSYFLDCAVYGPFFL